MHSVGLLFACLLICFSHQLLVSSVNVTGLLGAPATSEASGPTAFTGATGTTGTTGPIEAIGATGRTGTTESNETNGATGDNGSTGSTGIIGLPDATGPLGHFVLRGGRDRGPCGDSSLTASTSWERLFSPGYPNNYQNNMYCIWTISAPTDYRITMQVYYMDTESNRDFLSLYQVSSGELSELAQLSGTTTGTYSTATNSARILFMSDGNVTYSGWQLYYYATDIFYPFGTSVGDSVAPVNDDGYTSAIGISAGFKFFGSRRTQMFVSTNGVTSFNGGISTYTPLPFPLSSPPSPMIAVYWADVDTRINNGRIYYRQSTDSALLARATRDIQQANIPGLALNTFQAGWLFIATWHNVTYYGGSNTTSVESFQTVLITDGTYSFAMYNYGTLAWTTGTASGGSASTGLGGTPAQVGFNAGDSVNYYAVPWSRTPDIKNMWTSSNCGTIGRWIFRIDGTSIAASATCPPGCIALPSARRKRTFFWTPCGGVTGCTYIHITVG